MSELTVRVPAKLRPLHKPARYKGAHGGRGGGKSHFFAQEIVIRCLAEPLRVVCIREVQNSIKESVRQLIVDKIDEMGVGHAFEVLENEIRGKNGALIIFKGMQAYNAANIKSLEGFDLAWVEEAQTLSAVSLRMLRPTLRKEGSELWFSWNPRHDTDPVDAFFRQAPRDDAICVEINWQDNPWFPDVLRRDMEQDYATDAEMAEHVWGGGYEIVSEASYYARLIADAEREGRIGDFPHNPAAPVKTAWDIGVDDYTAVWFIQDDGFKSTVIDYYEASGDGAEQIVATMLPEHLTDKAARNAALDVIERDHPFRYARHFLPHDVKNREWGAGGRSRLQTLFELGLEGVHRGAAMNPQERINAVRQLLPTVRFNTSGAAGKRVSLGLRRLRMYRRKWNEQLQTFMGPLHDEASHGADAFGEYAINALIKPEEIKPEPRPEIPVFMADELGRVRSNMTVRELIEHKRRRQNADA
jgi:phage terminase large subunit